MPGATPRLGLPFALDGESPNGPSITEALALAVEAELTPPGTLLATAAAAAPDGYLLCDGSSKQRSTYPDLFDAIGTAYGSVDSLHFTLPDLRGRVPVGVDGAAGRLSANDALAQAAGEEKHTLSEGELAAHAHKERGAGGGGGADFAYHVTVHSDTGGNVPVAEYTDNAGSGTPHNNMPPYQVVNYMIKT